MPPKSSESRATQKRKKTKTAPPRRAPSETESGRTEILLDNLQQSVSLSLEATLMTREVLSQRIDGLQDRMDARFEVLEASVRQNSKDIVVLEASVRQNSKDIVVLEASVRQNSKDIVDLRQSVDRLEPAVRGLDSRVTVLEERPEGAS